MSYIRAAHPHIYVEGTSDDYVFPYRDGNGEIRIEDYAKGLTKEGLCEILCRVIDMHFKHPAEKKYFMQHLADKLGVKLREKPREPQLEDYVTKK